MTVQIPFVSKLLSVFYNEIVKILAVLRSLQKALRMGEFFVPALIGYLLLASFTVLTITIFFNLIVAWIKGRNFMNLVMTILLIAELGSYVYFCFSYPYTCTMSFRYIVPTIIAGAYYTGRSKEISPRLLSAVTTAATYVFAAVSLVFYCLVWIKD